MIYRRVEKNLRPELEDPGLVPFNIDAVYVVRGGTPYGRYVKILIIFC
jgi:hypothetical protein